MIAKYGSNMPVSEFPLIVNLEVFRGQCPCRCRHCPLGLVEPRARAASFGLAAVELGLLRKVAVEIAKHPPAILRIHSTGEPLLWSDLPAALAILREVGVWAWLFTSAISTSRSLLLDICRSVRVIEVSVNSISREDYAVTKGTDMFDQVVQNIRIMREMLGKQPGARLIVSRVQSEDPLSDAAFVEHWKCSGLVDDAFVRTMHTYNRLIPGLRPSSDNGASTDAKQHLPCLVHWARFNLASNGQAIVCFNELFKSAIDPKLVYGNVNEQSIASIWQGDKMQAVRLAALSGDYSSPLIANAVPCRHCDNCQSLFGKAGVKTSECQIVALRRAGAEGVPGEDNKPC